MMGCIELEAALDNSNTVSTYLNPHKRWIDHLADQVMDTLAGVPHGEAIQDEPAGTQQSVMLISRSQRCPCLSCSVMREL
jgi:hypothetical protein